jgi:two-component system chemotaxis response regulator CheB
VTAHSGARPRAAEARARAGIVPLAVLSVVLVADSRTRTCALRSLLAGPGLVVVAEVTTAQAAEAAVVEHQPGAVLIDLAPDAGGIEAIERIMGTRATPIVVCGQLVAHFKAALAAGAVDVIGELEVVPGSPQYATAVRRHLRVASRARVITHPRSRLRQHGLTTGSPVSTRPTRWLRAASGGVRIVAIGASTGGPPALAAILGALPPDLPVPVLVVQHMAEGFVEGLASWLNGVSPLSVVMAQNHGRLLPGTVYVAPAGSNAILRRGLSVELCPAPAGQFHVPGVDATFTSVAATCGVGAIGVLLTGMGRDGAQGLRIMRERGAVTIGQDEQTSVVWGMPAAAQALRAVELELPLPEIGRAIVRVLRERGVAGTDPAALA